MIADTLVRPGEVRATINGRSVTVRRPLTDPCACLTERQREAVRCFCTSGSGQEAAEKMFLSYSGFKNLLTAAYRNLGIRAGFGKHKAAAICYELGRYDERKGADR